MNTMLVDQAVDNLMEHFDSVRIFVTKHDGPSEDTGSYTRGGGNFYAQVGQVTEWNGMQDQIGREHVKKEET